MKIALSVWKDSISTVFDAADQLMIVDPASDKQMSADIPLSGKRSHQSSGGNERAGD